MLAFLCGHGVSERSRRHWTRQEGGKRTRTVQVEQIINSSARTESVQEHTPHTPGYFFFLPLPPLPFFPPPFFFSRSRLALRPRHIFCSIVAALWSVACCACTRASSSACTTQRGLRRKWSCDRAGRAGGGQGRKARDWGARLLALDRELRFPLDHELVEVVL